jgi:hypothetical protein
MESYRDTALKSAETAKVALEVFMQHPTKPQSPKPNPYTQGLMWNVMMRYPKLFLDQVSELTGQAPEALHKYMLLYAQQVARKAPVEQPSSKVNTRELSPTRGMFLPGFEDTPSSASATR